MSSLNLVFAGTPEFGLPCLEALSQSSHSIKAVYTQPDRPSGRGRKVQSSAVKEWALAHDLPIYQPLNFKDPNTVAELAALKPDVMIVIAYGLLLPKAVLEVPKYGCINVHASLLPRWRGASPIQKAILHGDEQSGVTIMQMDVGLDTGAMWSSVSCPITPLDTAGSLHDKLATLAAAPLLEVLNTLSSHAHSPKEQMNDLATYAGKITKDDARIDWKQSAAVIDRQIRAYNPWPIAFTVLNEEVLRVHEAKPTGLSCSQAPGTILNLDKKGILVATGHEALLVEKIQFPGGKVITVADWLNAGKNQGQVGLVLQ